MKTEELEHLIEGQKEHPGLDFKASCPWDAKKLAKDILAMSNLPDGGYIVIGVEELNNTFVAKGISEADCQTYVLDEMRDQVGKYADPMADFTVSFPKDSKGLTFVVIKIFSFREVPVICKKDLDKELKVGTIYYRNTNRRVESAAISNVNDLRDIIELAAVRLMQRRRSFGFTIPDNNHQLYQDQIDAVNTQELVRTIKSRGYCEASIIPLATENLDSLSRCLEVVEKAQVRLAWEMPVIPRGTHDGKLSTADNCYQGISDFGARKELWRMHLSEHFFLINSYVEDWFEEDSLRKSAAANFPSGKYFFFYTTLMHYLTQLYSFVERLATQGLYKNGAQISITFHNTANRELYIGDSNRMPLIRTRTTGAGKIIIESRYSQQQLIEESIKLSNAAILNVLEYFEFHPSQDSVQIEQLEYLNNR